VPVDEPVEVYLLAAKTEAEALAAVAFDPVKIAV